MRNYPNQQSWDGLFWNWVSDLKQNGFPLQRGIDMPSDLTVLFTYKPEKNILVASLDIGKGPDTAERPLLQARDTVTAEISGDWEWDENITEAGWGCAISGQVPKN